MLPRDGHGNGEGFDVGDAHGGFLDRSAGAVAPSLAEIAVRAEIAVLFPDFWQRGIWCDNAAQNCKELWR
jgi:hypothetical protein